MRRILFLLMCALVSTTMFAQILSFKTTSFYSSENTSYGWSNWVGPQQSSMLVQMDLTNDLVFIDSPHQQLYQIVSTVSNGYDSEGNYVREFRFIDQDGDRGTMKLVGRKSGQSQIYIIFNNIRWCYDVVQI